MPYFHPENTDLPKPSLQDNLLQISSENGHLYQGLEKQQDKITHALSKVFDKKGDTEQESIQFFLASLKQVWESIKDSNINVQYCFQLLLLISIFLIPLQIEAQQTPVKPQTPKKPLSATPSRVDYKKAIESSQLDPILKKCYTFIAENNIPAVNKIIGEYVKKNPGQQAYFDIAMLYKTLNYWDFSYKIIDKTKKASTPAQRYFYKMIVQFHQYYLDESALIDGPESFWAVDYFKTQDESKLSEADKKYKAFALAMDAYNDGNFKKSSELFTRCVEGGLDSGEVLAIAATAHLRARDLKKTRETLTKAFEKAPYMSYLYVLEAETLLTERKISDMMPAYNNAVVLNRYSFVTYLSLATTQVNFGYNKQARRFTKVAIKQNPHSSFSYFQLGRSLKERGLYNTEALQAYKKSLELNPMRYETYQNIVACHMHLRQKKEAIEMSELAISYFPDKPGLYYNRALIAEEFKNYKLAAKHFRKTLDLGFVKQDILDSLFTCYRKTYDKQGQLFVLKKQVEVNPSSFVHNYNLAMFYRLDKQNKKAADAYAKAIKLNPKHGKSYFSRAECLRLVGQEEETLKVVNQGLKVDSVSIGGYLIKGYITYGLKDYKKCIKNALVIQSKKPGEVESAFLLACAYDKMGEKQKAIHYYTMRIKGMPSHTFSYFSRAIMYKDTQQYKKSLQDFQLVLKREPNHPKKTFILTNIALLQQKIDQRK